MAPGLGPKGGIALSGGGARGAYQAGVLKGLADIASRNPKVDPFRVITGVSSGAVNTSFIAARAQNFSKATEELCEVWATIKPNKVFKVDNISLFSNGVRVLKKLMFGGMEAKREYRHHQLSLLNTIPSRKLFSEKILFDQIPKNLEAGHFDALALSATDYATSVGVTFVKAKPGTLMWERANRFSIPAEITCDHVMASSAIPIFFPAILIGQRYFGDGCLRNTAPLSPAIRLGANRLIVIGVRRGSPHKPVLTEPALEPGIGKILNTVINSVFMDGMEVDIERMTRVNATLNQIHSDTPEIRTDWQPIRFVYIKPTEDIGDLAKMESKKLPRGMRYLLSGLGSVEETADIVSYLLFEGSYCKKLIELGVHDCLAKEDEISAIFQN